MNFFPRGADKKFIKSFSKKIKRTIAVALAFIMSGSTVAVFAADGTFVENEWKLTSFSEYKYDQFAYNYNTRVYDGMYTATMMMKSTVTGDRVLAYCADKGIVGRVGEIGTNYSTYPAEDLDHLSGFFNVNYEKVKTVLYFGFSEKNGQNNLSDLRDDTGINNLNGKEAARATQFAIWSLTGEKYDLDKNARKLTIYSRDKEGKLHSNTTLFDYSGNNVYRLFIYLMDKADNSTINTSTQKEVSIKAENLNIDASKDTPELNYDIALSGEGVSQLTKLEVKIFDDNIQIGETRTLTGTDIKSQSLIASLNGYTKDSLNGKPITVKITANQEYEDYFGLRYLEGGDFKPLEAQTLILSSKTKGTAILNAENSVILKDKPTDPPVPANPSIGTTATANGEKTVEAGESVTVTDEVKYENLEAGKEYTLKGRLIKKSDGTTVVAEATGTFTPSESSGTVKIDFTFNASDLGGDSVVAFEELLLGETKIAEHADINDEGQTVKITVKHTDKKEIDFSKVDMSGTELPGAEIEIYKGEELVDSWTSGTESHKLSLEPGVYTFKETAAPDGYLAVTDFTFTVKEDGTITLGTIGQGETVETKDGTIIVTDNAKSTEPAVPDDPKPQPSLETFATDKSDGDKILPADENVIVIDKLAYKNLEAGKEYTVNGKLVKKSDNGKTEIASSTMSFVPETSSGVAEMDFKFNTSGLAGESVVAYQYLFVDGKEVVSHADINNADQTVRILSDKGATDKPDTPDKDSVQTGDTANPVIYLLTMLVSMLSAIVLIVKRKTIR
ncbi:MAG TPA: VaFE repeat-containing surface-anchored protein [Mogibacterium sp.]|nr:VaFE repeat-containing surface-anchored protein [Mogibacterium sp.]